jgi:NAD(P)-dependent dehydrogenase (short-subunit alcohol dehydrogenase family)
VSRTYVVTGAASGIGAATVAMLETLGHRTIGVDRRGADVLADLATVDGRRLLVDEVGRRSGGAIDAVIACAGTFNRGRLDVQVNFFGAVETLEGLRPLLAAGDAPRAVAVTSFAVVDAVDADLVDACLALDEDRAMAAVDALPLERASRTYASSKRALARWVRRIAVSECWAGAGIAVNTVAPGIVRTPMTSPILDDPAVAPFLLDGVPMPLGGVLGPEAIAHHLVALTDPHLLGMTGQTAFVDGGAECMRRGDDVFGAAGPV